jgi:RimJ/RimL family protein N-acetyltransferase
MSEQLTTRPVIQAQRLLLRPVAMADAARLAELANDFEVVKTTGGMPFPYTLADAEGFVRRAEACDPELETFFSVDLPGEGPIGTLGFYATGELGPEVGYWLGRRHWGGGLATEMLKTAMSWVRRDWGKRCVLACHQADNSASGAVLGRAGFLYTGRVEERPCKARGERVAVRWMAWLA